MANKICIECKKPYQGRGIKFCSNKCSTKGKNHPFFGKKHTKKTKIKIGIKSKGRKNNLGKHWKLSEKIRIKKSQINKGEKCYRWKGGITPQNRVIRNGIEYRLWREAVFARDNWTCQHCGKRDGGELHPHHIKSFSKFPELRFVINNGITFCKKCHRKKHNYKF